MREPERSEHTTRADGVCDRRGFLAGAAAAAAAGALGTRAPSAAAQTGAARGRAKNLIFLSADGLSPGALSLGDVYARRKLGRPLRWLDWIASGRPRRALVATEPADWMVTDSAAAASAWSIGERVDNDAICVTPDGREPTPLLVRAKRSGRRVGVITTTHLTDASPAAMVANARSRADTETIAGHFLQRGVDLAVGGGGRRFDDEAMLEHGVTPVRDPGAFEGAMRETDGRLFALLTPGDWPYELERPASFPSLASVTRAAIERLDRGGEGFALFVESEDTDTASHSNDAAALMRAVVAFDEALGAALAYASGRDDTLVIATTDHACCNPGFTRYAPDAEERFERLAGARGSLRTIMRRFRAMGDRADAGALAALVREHLSIELRDRDVQTLDRWLRGGRVDPFDGRNGNSSPLASVLSNHNGVAFVSYTHTLDYVEATGEGPGAEALTGARHHVDVHKAAAGALGLV